MLADLFLYRQGAVTDWLTFREGVLMKLSLKIINNGPGPGILAKEQFYPFLNMNNKYV